MAHTRRLTALEASFLAMEQPGLPMHVAAVLLLEPGPPVTMAELRHTVASRLGRLPHFRDRLSGGPWALLRPAWVTVARVDLARHLFHHRLPKPGSRAQFNAVCARIHEQVLSRDRPLWEIHLIDGLRNGGQAVMIKMHHSITDGIAGVEIAETLFDSEPQVSGELQRPCTRFADGMRPSPLTAAQAMLGAAVTAAGGPIALPGPFNGSVGPRRSFATATIPLDLVRAAKHQFGGTIDDVIVAIATAGLRDYLAAVACPDVPHALRAMLPVSTRSGRGGGLGNHVTAVFVDLPMAPIEFGDLVRAIAIEKSALRGAHAATGAVMAVSAAGLLPNPLHSAVVRFATGLRSCNLVLSDVPAPEGSLFMQGRRIIASYPLMPLGASIGLSVAVLGMSGRLGLGITADPDLVPSTQHLADAIDRVVAHLERALPHAVHAQRAA